MVGVVYDTGALLAAERANRALWVLNDEMLRRGVRPVVPSVVLAQAWRGGPQPNLSRLLKGCVIESLAENAAREVGRLLAAAGRPDIVDAAVVVSAGSRGDLIVTSDPDDLAELTAALDVRLSLHVI
ncbi:MAG: twitching motility protein PilT [Pseudonocardiales bacterium]|nr:twitching motility protein PilT [Pseudonocardiales bacterium]